ncbi:MAG: helix-turn-helix transcriptional regulator [Rhodocyclaceae bacterium]|uniref:F40 n=1 Tax=metagenome TaxID=256318 RepID=A0A380TH22_9ZZZZ|nr:helix-turn-helix transcriptional regulator [Rhodocyclaceae bacterium]SUS07740.1 F40 [uncultured Defluviicoccus sp.]
MPTFGEKIRHLRKAKQLTLDQLAERTSSSKSYIWELENKNPPRPSAEKIAKIAETLGVTADFLMDETERSPTPDVVDEAFFRKYRRLEPETKAKIRQLVELWDEN